SLPPLPSFLGAIDETDARNVPGVHMGVGGPRSVAVVPVLRDDGEHPPVASSSFKTNAQEHRPSVSRFSSSSRLRPILNPIYPGTRTPSHPPIRRLTYR